LEGSLNQFVSHSRNCSRTGTTKCHFLRAKAATALARLSYRNSVRLSVSLSVTRYIGQKWCKLGLPNFHCRLSGKL